MQFERKVSKQCVREASGSKWPDNGSGWSKWESPTQAWESEREKGGGDWALVKPSQMGHIQYNIIYHLSYRATSNMNVVRVAVQTDWLARTNAQGFGKWRLSIGRTRYDTSHVCIVQYQVYVRLPFVRRSTHRSRFRSFYVDESHGTQHCSRNEKGKNKIN